MTFVAGVGMSLLGGMSYSLAFFDPRKLRPVARSFALSVFFNGFCFHLLMLVALEHASSGNVALLSTSEVFFTFIVFHFFSSQRESHLQRVAACLIVSGALFVLLEKASIEVSQGELFVLLACVLAPFGNLHQQQVVREVSPLLHLYWRNWTVFVISVILSWNELGNLSEVSSSRPWIGVIGAGVLAMFAAKLLLLEGLKRLNGAKTIAMSCSSPAVTLVAAIVAFGQWPTGVQLAGLALVLAGVGLMIRAAEVPERDEAK